MPFLLRGVRKARWTHDQKPSWLSQTDIPADTMDDLGTKSNSLSLWHVEDDESNLDEVVVAIAASRDWVANLDYVLVDLRFLSQLDIPIEATPVSSPLPEADCWHRDLVHLSAQKLVRVAEAMWDSGRTERRSEKAVQQLLAEAVESGRINQSKLNDKIRSQILA